MTTTTRPFLILVAALLLTALPAWAQDTRDDFYWCPVEPGPGTVITPGNPDGGTGGGMAGNGWDGAGTNAATVFWHIDGTTPDFGADQRAAIIAGMQAWANVVQITFQEVPLANQNQSVDWDFLVRDHSATEPAEAASPAICAFDGPGGVFAHAGFPPGVNSTCVNPMAESWAGNVHFDEAETWELDDAGGAGPLSLTLLACHEVGHGIGLTHSNNPPGLPDVMRPFFNSTQAFVGISANDTVNVQAGYATGAGSVITLETSGIWVDGSFGGTELGTQASPFDTVAEGPANAPPFTSVTVHIETGTYAESPLTISNASILNAENGTVRIE